MGDQFWVSPRLRRSNQDVGETGSQKIHLRNWVRGPEGQAENGVRRPARSDMWEVKPESDYRAKESGHPHGPQASKLRYPDNLREPGEAKAEAEAAWLQS